MTIKSKYLRNLLSLMAVFAAVFVLWSAPVGAQPAPAPDAPAAVDPSERLRADAECVGDESVCVCPKDNPAACEDPALQDCSQKDCNIIAKYLNPFINLMTIVVGIAVTIGIIVGGIQYSASGGDPQKAANGKKHIRNAIIALIAYMFLYAFIRFLTPGNGLFKV